MKKVLCTIAVFTAISNCLSGQNEWNKYSFDFETFDTTPYVFRYGNHTSVNHYPRWQYSHEVAANPAVDDSNPSAQALRYTSLEARRYGLKIRFPAPLNIEDIDTIRFLIYQPATIIGRPVHATYSATPATSQEIRVKLLTYFNTTKDHIEDAGVELSFSGAAQPFTTANEWVVYRLAVSESKLAQSDRNKLQSGVLGLAILPTYNSGVTLQSRHVCFLDDITVKRSSSSSNIRERPAVPEPFRISCDRQTLTVRSDAQCLAHIRIFSPKGETLLDAGQQHLDAATEAIFPLPLPAGVYFVSIRTEAGRYYNYKIAV